MRTLRTALAAAAAAGIALAGAGSAEAQSSMVNGVPTAEVEMGAGFWYVGSKKFGVNLFDTASGAKVSQLDFTGGSAAMLELSFRLNSLDNGIWARVGGGVGVNFGGSLTDQDFDLPGYSKTTQGLGSGTPYHFSGDIGWTPGFEDRWPVKISPFAGIFYMHDSFNANRTLTCHTFTSPLCFDLQQAGTNTIDGSLSFITNDVSIWGPRVGAAASYAVTSRLSVSAEAAYLFLGQYKNEDNHSDVYHFRDAGHSASGYQLQIALDYKVPESGWTVGGGYRWWHFDSGKANSTWAESPNPAPEQHTTNKFEVSGVFLRGNYGF